MTASLQELIDQAAVRVAPSSKDGQEKERRAMIPLSRLKWFEAEWRKVARPYDSSECLALERRLWKLWKEFTGRK